MTKVAVTSASGNLGSSIINNLIEEIGIDNVIGVARNPQKAKHLGVEIRKGDYNSIEEFNDALKGVDALLIISGNDKPEKRIKQHQNIIEAAKFNNVKKIVYTSIIGDENGLETAFSPIIKSNRHTEQDVKNSGLDWVIGRNGLYIEPDIEYIDNYIKKGGIINCAGNGKCCYTSRKELANAYTNMLLKDIHNGQTYNLTADAISQKQLADYINQSFNINLKYKSMSVDDYSKDRKKELGDFVGGVIGGIYEEIKNDAFNVVSNFEKVTGRPHKLIQVIINDYKKGLKH